MAIPACGVGNPRRRRLRSPQAAFFPKPWKVPKILKVFKVSKVPEESWHGVVSAAAPGVTAKQALHGKPQPFQRSVLPQSLYRILAARGREAARWRRQGRNEALVYPDKQDEQPGHHVRRFTYWGQCFHGCEGVCFASSGTPFRWVAVRRTSKGKRCRARSRPAQGVPSAAGMPRAAAV